MRTGLAVVALVAVVTALARSAQPPAQRAPATLPHSLAPTPESARTPVPPQLDRTVLNRQDRVGRAHRARETRVFDSRPLVLRLPLTRGGVRIDLAGLAADDHATVLSVNPGTRSRRHARGVYHWALQRFADSGKAYVVEWSE